MLAEELRIANFIYAHGKIQQVEQIGNTPYGHAQRVIFFKGSPIGEYAVNCAGIPLTEDWLVRAGFEYEKTNKSWQLDTEFGFSIWGRIDIGFSVFGSDDVEIGNTFEYVHQLQNLYHALTGEELTVKE